MLVSDREVGLIRATVVPVEGGGLRASDAEPSTRSGDRPPRRTRPRAGARAEVGHLRGESRARPGATARVRGRDDRAATQGDDAPGGLCVVVDARTGRVLTTWRGGAAHAVDACVACRRGALGEPSQAGDAQRSHDRARRQAGAGTADRGRPVRDWRAILPQSVPPTGLGTDPRLHSCLQCGPRRRHPQRQGRGRLPVRHARFCSRDGTDDPRKPFRLTGNDTSGRSAAGRPTARAGTYLPRSGPRPPERRDRPRGRPPDPLVRAARPEFATREQRRWAKASRTCSPTTSTARTRNSARTGRRAGNRRPLAAGTRP